MILYEMLDKLNNLLMHTYIYLYTYNAQAIIKCIPWLLSFQEPPFRGFVPGIYYLSLKVIVILKRKKGWVVANHTRICTNHIICKHF